MTGNRTAQPPAQPPAEPAQPTPPGQSRGGTEVPREIGGPAGPEPTRYGDWERRGRCIDF
jgi:hypothetical protein